MRDTGTHISHNPTSNAKLGNGVARLLDYLQAGINVGLGHDSTEDVNTGDMFEVMKFASLIQRGVRLDANVLQAGDLLRMVTRNGSDALRHDTGMLAEGKKADVIVIELDDVGFTSRPRQSQPALFPSGLRVAWARSQHRRHRRHAGDAGSAAAHGRRRGDPPQGERGIRSDPRSSSRRVGADGRVDLPRPDGGSGPGGL
jgi:cytosine/adenosine deaminase-related metal-dependent hydrolase